MIEIDGSYGEGGGQVLRTSLTLAAQTGQSVHFTRIRAKRRKTGLMRQHLACAKAVAELTGGTLNGAELNSQEMTFVPTKIRSGKYRFVVGSAGSVILVAQTVLPCLLHANGVSTVVIEGGTHAADAPIYDYFERVYLPCLRRMGVEISATLNQTGFYPVGGGIITLEIKPIKCWRHWEILETGALKKASLTAISHGIDEKIGIDELQFCQSALKTDIAFTSESKAVNSPGPGNVMFAELEFEHITELFSVCGDFDIPRKEIGERVAKMVHLYRKQHVPVWRFLADQLLVPMAIGAGGKYRTVPPSKHTETNIDIIQKFLDVKIILNNLGNGQYIIEVKK